MIGSCCPTTCWQRSKLASTSSGGEEDPFGGPDIAREFVKHISNSDLELLPGTGHAVWVDHPDHATKVVESLFRD